MTPPRGFLTTWFHRGVLVGVFLAVTESFVAVASGHDLSAVYLLVVAAFDVAAGLVSGLLAALLARAFRPRGGVSFAAVFVPLATATTFVYLFDKSIVAATFRRRPGALGLALLVLAAVVGCWAGLRVVERKSRTIHSDHSAVVGILLLILFLVGGRYVTKALLGSYVSVEAVTVNALLVGLVLFGLRAQDVLFAREPRLALSPRNLAVVFVLVGLGGTGAAWTASAPPPYPVRTIRARLASGQRPSIVLVSIDTLRADRLSAYGYDRPTTPALDQLASEAVLFRRALSPGNWTVPAHASLLTGTFAVTHGALEGEHPRLAAANRTLAERLSAAGYRTGAVVANSSALNRQLGFDQGFGFYDDRPGRTFGYSPLLNGYLTPFPLQSGWVTNPYRLAEEITDTAGLWLDRNADAPFFLFLNYMEPHDPYAPPPPYHDRFPGRSLFLLSPEGDVLRDLRDPTSREVEHFRALYDGEVSYVDACVGRLLDKLRQLGVYEQALVIVTSDHGEFFGEHRLWGHCMGPYEPVHRVPLIVRYPGASRRGTEEGWVELVDVAPTVLDVAGLPPAGDLQGTVLPHISHPILIEAARNANLARQFGRRFDRGYRGLYEDDWKLVSYTDGDTELFNLREDPGEAKSLAADHEDLAKKMRDRLDSYWAQLPRRNAAPEIDGEAQRRLKAAGYVD